MKIIERSGARIPAIGLGTFRLDDETSPGIVRKAIECGYRHIDTARMYGNEKGVGQGIRDSGIDRDELFVTTKIWWSDIGRSSLVPTAVKALVDLQMEQVDLLLIHWPNPDIPLEESIAALNEARTKGLTKHIGVANFTSTMMDEAQKMSEAPLVCNQVEYHPTLSQDAILAACKRNDMALVAYSPIGQGGDLLQNPEIVRIAEAHSKTPAQVVLRWEIEQDGVAAIPRTSNPDRLAENIDVFDFELTDDDRNLMERMTRLRKRLVNPGFAPKWDRA
ncbi:aldo/keto reductase [Aureimonas mangrovi]|uniref:aldo/keto reductase n=1 Tax=Aureimonas mangrovi TaxID=2758041 RepID=UPI00163D6F8E|nr:aldo/keto reductase [Aureimonas mangrovi]